MRYSPDLLEAVAAALPPAEQAGIAASEVHGRVAGGWTRTTVRHALRVLVATGRADFCGVDRHRKYRRAGAVLSDAAEETGTPEELVKAEDASDRWRDYALRGDGGVRLPDEAAVGALMRQHGVRYEDVSADELAREERHAGWSHRKPSSAELTRAVFGDPMPGRHRPFHSEERSRR